MSVRPDRSRGCFWVESKSDPLHEHFVDLVAHNGKGECGCDHWKYRCQPAIKEGRTLRCSHIEAARDHIASSIAPHLSFRDRQFVLNNVIRKWIEEER
jgi:hypothetical protein